MALKFRYDTEQKLSFRTIQKKNIFGPIYNIKKHKNVLFNFDALENLEDLK